MTDTKKNIGANLFGNIWQVLISLLFVPLYVKFMGVESYGLVGIFVALITLTGIMDMGLSGTMNREMARRSAFSQDGQEIRNFVRSLEIIYWSVAIVIGVIIIFVSPFIANHWVKAQNLSTETIEHAFLFMGVSLAVHFPASFYLGGLYGLQKQVLLNAINITIVTMRGLGAVLILWQISPTIEAFFMWQIFISAVYTALPAYFLWRNLPPSENKPAFQMRLVRSIGKFAAGIAAISILNIILTQLDKVILSRILSLELFGYYALAGIIAMSSLRIAWPVYFAVYPRFTQLIALADYGELKILYHKSCQLVSVLTLPFSMVVALFSYELVLLWTQNSLIAEKTHLIVSILICGTALNTLLSPPAALQLGFGWTRLLFYKNLLAVVVLVPLIIYMATSYGAIGAAWVWVILNLASVFFEIPLMHRRLLRGEKKRWFLHDVLIPLVAALSVAGAGRYFMPEAMSKTETFLYLVIVFGATLAAAAIATQTTRTWLCAQVAKVWGILNSKG